MLSEFQQGELHNLIAKHKPLYLWSGSFKFFKSMPTPATASFILDCFNRPDLYMFVAKETGLPLYPSKSNMIELVLDHVYINLNAEKEMIYNSIPVNIEVYGEKIKPAVTMKWSLWNFPAAAGISMGLMFWIWGLCTSNQLESIYARVNQRISESIAKIIKSSTITEVALELESVMMNFAVLTVTHLIVEQYVEYLLVQKFQYDWETIERFYTEKFADRNLLYQSEKQLKEVASNKMRIADYLAKYGNLATMDFELSEPRYNEDETRLRTVIRDIQKEPAPPATQGQLPAMNWFERSLAERYWESLAYIGSARVQCMAIVSHLRSLLIVFASQNAVPGDAIFFMRRDEIVNKPQSFIEEAKQREIRYLQNKNVQLPQLLTDEVITNMLLPYTKGGKHQLVPISAGVVTAKLKCVKQPEDANCPDNNCILVFPDGKPAYTQYYKRGVGVIFEKGGATTHGAILAREYKMPAISLGGQKLALEDGMVVTIDGEAGTLQIQ